MVSLALFLNVTWPNSPVIFLSVAWSHLHSSWSMCGLTCGAPDQCWGRIISIPKRYVVSSVVFLIVTSSHKYSWPCLSDCGCPCANNSVAIFIILPPSRTVKKTGSTKHREVWTSTNQSKIKHQWIMKICVLRCIIECFHCQTCFCCKTWAAGHCTMEFVLWRGPGWKSFSDVFHCTVDLVLLCGFGDKSYSGFVVFKELKSLIFL